MHIILILLSLHGTLGQNTTTPTPPATTPVSTTTSTTTTTTTTTTPTTTLEPRACDAFTSGSICSFTSPSSILTQIEHTHDEYACQRECQKLDACSHFSWMTYPGDTTSQCFLFRDCEDLVACPECATTLSGPSHPSYVDACCSVFAHSICGQEASTLSSFKVNTKTSSECQRLCQEDASCEHFTHDLDTCFLFTSCSTYEECDSCLSGPTSPSLEVCFINSSKIIKDMIFLRSVKHLSQVTTS